MAIINGTIGNDTLIGTISNDIIYGFEGDDYLDGGAGADTMEGGSGNDTYVVDTVGDLVIENANEGTDTVRSSITYTLGAYLENLTLTGSVAINGYGNALDNVLIGNSAANYLAGGDGNDTLNGGAGADVLVGGTGDDILMVDSSGDVVVENANEGTDTIQSSIAYTLGLNVENLTLTGTAAINGTGNTLANILTGNAGANILNGGAGADTMAGGAGNDTYVVDNVDDIVIENPYGGTDIVQSSVTYTLSDNVENLTLTGTAAINGTGNALNNDLTGNSAANYLTGGDGRDNLDGGAGADTLAGGTGDDTYFVDNIGDIVLENVDEGTDTVLSSVTYTLSDTVENLTLTGPLTVNTNGYGNALNNVLNGNGAFNFLAGGDGDDELYGHEGSDTLTGGNGNDTLNGGAYYDSMAGGAGNDFYTVDYIGDLVIENIDEGTDTVQSSITYIMSADVENLFLIGTGPINGTGNALDNSLTGNSGGNILDGGIGADTMTGGAGNDTYVVDDIGDIAVENVNEGTDTIQISVTYTLDTNFENLILTGTDAINGTGNALNNVLIGNSAANSLAGGDGSDTLNGGAGADTLAGGSGDDIYVVDNIGDIVIENVDEGTDIVQSSVTYTLSDNVENLTLTGIAAINGSGNALNNVLIGNSAANALAGGDGNDDLYGDDGADTLSGGNGNDILNGGAGADMLAGDDGNDNLNGDAGADTLAGGSGDDAYVVDDIGDIVIENIDEGTDIIQSSVTYTLSDNVENLTLTGTAAINGSGNALNNVLTGNVAANSLAGGGGNDYLYGDAGADTLAGGTGNDTYVVDDIGDIVIENANEGTDTIQSSITYTLGATFENLTLTGIAAINGTGNALANSLTGNAAANILNGGTGADTLAGGAGDDTYVVDNIGDTVIENVDEGTDIIQSSVTYTLGDNVENLTLTGTVAINGTGNAFANSLTGNGLVNILNGGTGADTLAGGSGNDTYVVDDAGDTVIENLNAGTDTIQSSVTYTLSDNVENLTLTGAAAIDGTGNALNNALTGNSAVNALAGGDGNDTLNGGAGADTLAGGSGNDTYVVDNTGDIVIENVDEGTDIIQSSATFTLSDNVENLTLTGTAAINGTGNTLNNVLTGNTAANVLTDGVGNDTLNGGIGADTLAGGTGDDIYVVDNSGDKVIENVDEGTDIVQSSATYTLSDNVENLTLTGSAAINGTGNALANILTGNSGINILNGGAGADTLAGGAGNDTYVMTDASDTVIENLNAGTDTVQSSITYILGDNLENLTLTGTAAISGTGNTLNNVLTGNTVANVLTDGVGNDTLNGGLGADSMTGGLGNDTYVVDNIGDVAIENVDEGMDKIQSSITYTLSTNIENLTLTGTTAINATGNALDNYITGNTGANILNGGAGADTLAGGSGNDTYVVDDADTVIENLNAGTDTVQSSMTYTLSANVENLTLTGIAAINGTGNALNNVLSGNSAANSLAGGLGNDTYVLNDASDTVVENVNEGADTIQSSITYTLGDNVENLTLTGTAAINGSGNALNNVLTGNSAANSLAGGLGNDTYVVGSGDIVIENDNEGTDTIQSSITYTLSTNVENLTLTGTAAIYGTGNALDNYITGNTGANILNGGTGADTLAGGTGNDTYVVDDADTVIENLNAGTDTVQSSITYILGDNLEKLTLTGTAAISGTGNSLNNVLTGNTAANVLADVAGNDTLNGGLGADSMTGGLGNDTYVVDNIGDIVVENVDEGTDLIQSSVTYTLSDNVENLTLTGTAAINGTGNALNNALIGTTAANALTGGDGADTITGGNGADTITGGVGADVIYLTEYQQVIDVVKVNAGDSLATGTDQIYKFNATATLNDKLDLESTAIAANGPADGIDVGGILSHSVTSGKISFIDAELSIQLEGYPLPMIINATNLADANNYLATNITSGENVAFYVDANSNGVYTDTTDYLRVFQGGATAAGTLSTDDIFVDIYTTSGLGGVTALGLAAAANTVQIV